MNTGNHGVNNLSVSFGDTLTVSQAFEFAVHLARQGVGFVSPNPPVGCVILNSDSQLIGYGYHQKFGEAHAEVNAINSVINKQELQGATVIVTLEPCAHQGKTPPCSLLLSKYKLKKVYYAVKDPNPRVAGRGLSDLQTNNIQLEQLPVSKELNSIMQPFLYSMQHSKPYVTVKVASSLDGQIALKTGESQWITGEESRKRVQDIRGEHDAVLIGAGTFLTDNPRLNSRSERFKSKENTVVILDPHGKTIDSIEKSKLTSVRSIKNIYVAVFEDKVPKKTTNFNTIIVPKNSSKDQFIEIVLCTLNQHNVASVFVEGGASVFSSFIQSNRMQRLVLFLAPSIIGAESGLSWSKQVSCLDLSQSKQLQRHSLELLGEDTCLDFRT